ncbi:hypothetical protein C347_03972 [Cryptococcus neoformans AD2-60a]|nr:hypothetical protein C347_03972 [Cryptococcus neoformans var. grubii AD2-60a]OXC84051.1 hypothetical protein C344_03668 [Cryptococcus neoformans var. grubii AD1-7a]OXH30815.1 hypothetical protein J005_03759 [Cryptococcus neoformans var. grubii]
MKTYPLALDLWDSGSSVIIRSATGTRIASFPLNFISRGGDNSWSYVLYVIGQLIIPESSRTGIIKDEHGRVLDPNEPPSAGVFFFFQEADPDPQLAQTDVSFSSGPEYFSSIKAPNPEGSISTRSDSKRSSVNQSRFRISLIARDGRCVVSGAHWESCTASHIVPASRPDIYDRFYGDEGGLPMFRPSAGLLLRDDLHHAFDRLMFSFYQKDGVFYVHCFSMAFQGASECHGKAIPPDWFRAASRDLPDPVLVKWHYSQCLKARIRGFSVDML